MPSTNFLMLRAPPVLRACESIPLPHPPATPAEAGAHCSTARTLSSVGKGWRLLDELGVVDGWVPACPTDQVRGLKAHGKGTSGLCLGEARSRFRSQALRSHRRRR